MKWKVCSNGIKLSCTKKEAKELVELRDEKGYYNAELEVLEDLLRNGGTLIPPKDLSALTEATIIKYDDVYYSDIAYYQLYSFVDLLIMEQKATINRI